MPPFSDTYSKKPEMGFKDYAAGLAEMLICAAPSQLTVGVFGDYGSGKTTLMRSIQARLDMASQPRPFTVWFNAWRFDHERHLLIPFLATLAQHKNLKDDPTWSTNLLTAMRAVIHGFAFKLPFIEWTAKEALNKEKELSQTAIQQLTGGFVDIEGLMGNLTRPKKGDDRNIVVFIDDLDRCVPAKAFALLEAVKAFADIEGFMFVIGLNPRVIGKYLEGKYGQHFGVDAEQYLEKIFQVPFQIPPPTWIGLKKAINIPGELAEILRISSEKCLANWNIRQLKRLLNRHEAISAASRRTLEPKLLLALLILQDRWPKVYSAFRQDGQGLVDNLMTISVRGGRSLSEHDAAGVARDAAKAWSEPTFADFWSEVLQRCFVDAKKQGKGEVDQYLTLMGRASEELVS